MSDAAEVKELSELVDEDRIAAVAAALDLRDPNRRALESIVSEVAFHYEVAGREGMFEGVVDVATGVGKTYAAAATIEYYAGEGVRNFVIVAPGRTILNKTIDNFTAGHRKSVLVGMETEPFVITTDNFDSPRVAAALEDESVVKLFIFTVQSLLAPANSDRGRKTREFQEGLGKAFYDHLAARDDLIVLADEHHIYYGPAFSNAIRGLEPYALIGLTATPHSKTSAEEIIYRYPLAAAVAEKLVKTPVIVGRKDDRKDTETKLMDGLRLIEAKKTVADAYVSAENKSRLDDERLEKINPVLFVVAQTIDQAREAEEILKRDDFLDGRYGDHVLVVTSETKKQEDHERMLELLTGIEEPDSSVRVVVSVGMLKEGWDVANIYAIVSLRASISDILTEQTLGRGLRLPFGKYTGLHLLDTVEVIAHERYDKLLQAKGLQETFIDVETRALLRQQEDGSIALETEETKAGISVVEADDVSSSTGAIVTDTDTRTAEAEAEAAVEEEPLRPRKTAPAIRIPVLAMHTVESPFSLNDITDLSPFRKLGERLAIDPEDELRREAITAEIITGADGLRETVLATAAIEDIAVASAPTLIPLDDAKKHLVELILSAPSVPARQKERNAAKKIVDEFVKGIGVDAPSVLSRYLGRAGARLVKQLTASQKKAAVKPDFEEVVELANFAPLRFARLETSKARKSKHKKGCGYVGWSERAMFTQAWFDSGTELTVANLLDEAKGNIVCWVRLNIGDLPILWSGAGREYNPDFIAIDEEGTHWVIEVKGNDWMERDDVQAKRDAAKRWANHVSNDPAVGTEWRYLLVSEDDVAGATGSWPALKSLGTL